MTIHFPSTICWKDCFSPIEWCWHSYWRSFDHIWKGLFPSFLFYSMSVCMSLAYYFDYCSFLKSFGIEKCETYNFFFLKIVLTIQDFFNLHINFIMDVSISEKISHWNFDKDCIESVISFGIFYILTILNLPLYEHMLSFHLFLSSSISFSNVL